MPSRSSSRPDYGIDAPGLVRAFLLGGAGCLSLAAFSIISPWPGPPWSLLAAVTSAGALYGLGMGGFMVFESWVGKVRDREPRLDALPWRGDERVLDVGCGRGLLLVAAARRVPSGHVVGIDLWQASDQSGNRPEGALGNARLEGVAERVEVQTADMRSLPFPDGHFDAVVSGWAVHNLEEEGDRQRALAEMVRVVRPGGHILVSDIQHGEAYAAAFAAFGLQVIRTCCPPLRSRIAGVLSFGNYWPVAVAVRKPDDLEVT